MWPDRNTFDFPVFLNKWQLFDVSSDGVTNVHVARSVDAWYHLQGDVFALVHLLGPVGLHVRDGVRGAGRGDYAIVRRVKGVACEDPLLVVARPTRHDRAQCSASRAKVG